MSGELAAFIDGDLMLQINGNSIIVPECEPLSPTEAQHNPEPHFSL